MKISHICQANSAAEGKPRPGKEAHNVANNRNKVRIMALTVKPVARYIGHNMLNTMPNQPHPKRQALQAAGTFNPRAGHVRHALFHQSDFFDPQDLLQLKYEILRALEADGYSIAQAAREFGLSRPTIYQAQSQFQQQGLEGLLPHKRGPHKPHKLTAEVREYLQGLGVAEPHLPAEELARRVRRRFGLKLHPRTIQKALHPKAKRGRLT